MRTKLPVKQRTRTLFVLLLLLLTLKPVWAESSLVDRDGGSSLRVVTYNHALLDFKNPLMSVYVPMRQSRRKAAPKIWSEFLNRDQPDVVLLQEIWYHKDFRRLKKAFESQGYVSVLSEDEVPRYKRRFGLRGHGLQVFFRKDKLELVSSDFRPFLDENGEVIRSSLENIKALFYKVKIDRGALLAEFRLKGEPSSKKVTLLTTHLTSRLEEQAVRNAQVEKLAELVRELDDDTGSIVLGADFNISPNFEGALEEDIEGFEINAKQYGVFLDASGMVDSYTSAESVEGFEFTQNRKHNILARRGFSTKPEPEQRLDFVFLARAKAQRYTTVLTERNIKVRRRKYGNRIPLSDHFGVMVDMQL